MHIPPYIYIHFYDLFSLLYYPSYPTKKKKR
jgi:hypothetical protein